jgi:hypothetical protein
MVLIIGWLSCATTPDSPPPSGIFELNPDVDCPHESQAGGWEMKARLFEMDDISYLAVYFDPGFRLTREPQVSVKTGFPVFLKQTGKVYYYRLGRVPRTRTVGWISFRTPARNRVGNEFVDNIVTLILERREITDCLRLIRR